MRETCSPFPNLLSQSPHPPTTIPHNSPLLLCLPMSPLVSMAQIKLVPVLKIQSNGIAVGVTLMSSNATGLEIGNCRYSTQCTEAPKHVLFL